MASKSSLFLQDKDEIRQVFERFDVNSDGKISSEELLGVLNALGSDSSGDEVARMMEEIDTDKDGYINLKEFTAFCGGNSDSEATAEKELRDAFEFYDQDHNGRISAAELHQVLRRLGEHCTEQECAGMIKSVDSDGDGHVGFEEFKIMMTNNKCAV